MLVHKCNYRSERVKITLQFSDTEEGINTIIYLIPKQLWWYRHRTLGFCIIAPQVSGYRQVRSRTDISSYLPPPLTSDNSLEL
jgi:hypothetical protein